MLKYIFCIKKIKIVFLLFEKVFNFNFKNELKAQIIRKNNQQFLRIFNKKDLNLFL